MKTNGELWRDRGKALREINERRKRGGRVKEKRKTKRYS